MYLHIIYCMNVNYMITLNVKFYDSSVMNIDSSEIVFNGSYKLEKIFDDILTKEAKKLKEILSKNGYNVSIDGHCFYYDYDKLNDEITCKIDFD